MHTEEIHQHVEAHVGEAMAAPGQPARLADAPHPAPGSVHPEVLAIDEAAHGEHELHGAPLVRAHNGNPGVVPPWLRQAPPVSNVPVGHDLAQVDEARSLLNAAVGALRDPSRDAAMAAGYAQDARRAMKLALQSPTAVDAPAHAVVAQTLADLDLLVRDTRALGNHVTEAAAEQLARRFDPVLDRLEQVLAGVDWE